jgi:hypothetical protein
VHGEVRHSLGAALQGLRDGLQPIHRNVQALHRLDVREKKTQIAQWASCGQSGTPSLLWNLCFLLHKGFFFCCSLSFGGLWVFSFCSGLVSEKEKQQQQEEEDCILVEELL